MSLNWAAAPALFRNCPSPKTALGHATWEGASSSQSHLHQAWGYGRYLLEESPVGYWYIQDDPDYREKYRFLVRERQTGNGFQGTAIAPIEVLSQTAYDNCIAALNSLKELKQAEQDNAMALAEQAIALQHQIVEIGKATATASLQQETFEANKETTRTNVETLEKVREIYSPVVKAGHDYLTFNAEMLIRISAAQAEAEAFQALMEEIRKSDAELAEALEKAKAAAEAYQMY